MGVGSASCGVALGVIQSYDWFGGCGGVVVR